MKIEYQKNSVLEIVDLISNTPADKLLDLLKLNTSDIKEAVGQIYFPVIYQIKKEIKFSARSWDKQITSKFLLPYDDERILECMSIVHYTGDTIRDLTIELSNMYGCLVGCTFCASGALTETPLFLTAIDLLKQLNTCITETGINPLEFEHFYVSYAGIGEPSLLYEEVSKSMYMIEAMYPNVLFNIATTGFELNCFRYWCNNNNSIRTIQLPYFSMDSNKLRYLVSNIPSDYDLLRVIRHALRYKSLHPQCRVKLNYLVICGYNDSNEQVLEMCSYLSEFNDYIDIKISYLNETKPSHEKGLISPSASRMNEIMGLILSQGFSCYIFGTESNPELGCGQLVQNYMLDKSEY